MRAVLVLVATKMAARAATDTDIGRGLLHCARNPALKPGIEDDLADAVERP